MGLPRGPRGEAEEAGRGGAGRGQTVFRPVEEDMEDPDVVLAFHHHGEVRHHPARRARVGGLRILGLGAVAAPRTTRGQGGQGGRRRFCRGVPSSCGPALFGFALVWFGMGL